LLHRDTFMLACNCTICIYNAGYSYIHLMLPMLPPFTFTVSNPTGSSVSAMIAMVVLNDPLPTEREIPVVALKLLGHYLKRE
jgi:hypothetical protein